MPSLTQKQPTMTNESVIPPLEQPAPRSPGQRPDELADDIQARPMTLPDFVNVPLANPNLSARWIFTDKRRFAQAKAQGWRVATKTDIKPGYAALTPFEEEGGTKYLNGDLILMVISKQIYLGALKYKHQVAAALSDAAVQRRLGLGRAANELGSDVATLNKHLMQQGQQPAMDVFTPGAADLSQTILGQPGVAAKEAGRIGNAGLDMGLLSSLTKQQAEQNQSNLEAAIDSIRGKAATSK